MFKFKGIKAFSKVLLGLSIFVSFADAANFQDAKVQYYGAIKTLVLSGNHYQMGQAYGVAMHTELQTSLNILEDFYSVQHHLSYRALLQQARLLYDRFPVTYQRFMQGVADGAGISLNDEIILNGMETLGELLPTPTGHCAFIALNPKQSESGYTLLGRNYDYSAPFDKIASYLSVVVLQEDNTVPTAFISLPGQIYCPTCVNAKGLFMELNNGMPSGGTIVDIDRQSLLISMLEIMQNSASLSQMEKELSATQTDFSLIVNTADKKSAKSYEFSSTLGMQTYIPVQNTNFVSTNFYLSPNWKNIPVPTDARTWMGVTRRNNLLNLAANGAEFNLLGFEKLMDTRLINGGAKWAPTIYQIIFDPATLNLYIELKGETQWSKIPLAVLFKDD